MRFGVLGSLQVDDQPAERRVAPGRLHQVMALLLSRAGGPVAVTELVDALWPQDPPEGAKRNIRGYIHRLRQALGDPERIAFGPAGYTLALQPDELDALEFEAGLEQARAAQRTGELHRADGLFERALRLWRGRPYSGLDRSDFLTADIEHLSQLRLMALESHAELGLQLGRHTELVPQLSTLVAEHPDRERLAALLMIALYRSNQQATALKTYRDTREILMEEYGVEPGTELRELHEAILRRDSSLDLGTENQSRGDDLVPSTPIYSPRPAVTPAQLPADVLGFAGRDDELERLDFMLARSGGQPTAVMISAVSGTAGVGKTALAIHWAHRIRDRFPDGQLYVNLRGFDPTNAYMDPAEALRGFLSAFDIPPERISADLHAQAALYRSILSNKRVLVVLDNARDPNQIRPLLPGSSGCLAVVTSRNDLAGLVSKDGAQPVTLDVLTTPEARELLLRRLGHNRLATDPTATAEIIDRCARMPLALTIVAARAAAHPHFPLRTLADELSHARLDTLAGHDSGTDMRTILSWSYRQLSTEAQRLFRLLGLHPGPDITAPAAASLIGFRPAVVRHLLVELTSCHLLMEHLPGRYTFHDLLRAYAAELVGTHDTEDTRRAATLRMLDHYIQTTVAGDRILDPHRELVVLPLPAEGVTPEPLVDQEHAMTWFATEQQVLRAALDVAITAELDNHTQQLAMGVATFFLRQGHWRDQIATWQAALSASERLGDRHAQARTHQRLANCHTKLGHISESHWHLQQAIELSSQLGDHVGQAHTYQDFTILFEQEGNYAKALEYAMRALDLYRQTGHQNGQGYACNSIGWYYALLGDLEEALVWCEQALALFQELVNHYGEAATWDSLGYANHHLGNHEASLDCYWRALSLWRRLDDRYNEAVTLTRLGDMQYAAADVDSARNSWQQAVTILEDLDHPDAGDIRVKLEEFGPGPS